MCLTHPSDINIALEDIVCYKFILIFNNQTYYGPFVSHYVYNINTIMKADYFGKYHDGNVYNAFHSYKNKNDAIRMVKIFNKRVISSSRQYVVVKCRIPKGSKYFEGMYDYFEKSCDGINLNAYASEELIIDEVYTPYKNYLKFWRIFINKIENFWFSLIFRQELQAYNKSKNEDKIN